VLIDPYVKLANAIIIQAAKDYRNTRKKLKKNRKNEEAKLMVEDLERFFRSDYFAALSDLDGQALLTKLEEEWLP
jgi:hypothetical protein